MPNEQSEMKINRLSPILAVPDILAAVDYYTRILGFERDWLWKDPPVHGAVHSGNIQIQFTLRATGAEHAPGLQFFLFVDEVEKLHALHVTGGAKIVSPIENKPWGLREYTVRDPWGYELRFAGPEKFQRPADARDSLPSNIRILERMPTVEEYLAVTSAVNWINNAEAAARALRGSVYGVVAVDDSDPGDPKTVGLLRVIGDGAMAFCIQDVAVMPSHQNQRIGTALIETALKSLRASAHGAFVGLFTLKPSFYERLGFRKDIGMHLKA